MRRIQSRRRSNRRRNFGSRTGSGSDRRRRNRSRSRRTRSRGRGSATRGWGNKSPNRKWKRREMYAKYGSRCFLSPKNLKFPICDRNGLIDRRGVESAYVRAKQYKYADVARKANRLLNR
jgi:hypothetical protein